MRWPVAIPLLMLALSTAPGMHAATRGSPAEISRALAALRREPANPRVLTDAGSQFALRASEQGFPTDVEDARRYLLQAAKMEPANAQTVAWLGALRCIEAKVRQSKGFVSQGLGQLDHAVQMDGNDLVVRMVRGSVSVEVPREYNKVDQGLADLEMVRAAHEKDPHALVALRIEPADMYLKLGKAYRAKGDMATARAMWTHASSGPPGKERETATRLLAKYGK